MKCGYKHGLNNLFYEDFRINTELYSLKNYINVNFK